MTRGFRPGLSYCEASGRLVFLDIVQDRYFCLREEAERAVRDWMATGEVSDNPSSRVLIGNMLIDRAEGCSIMTPTSEIAAATRSICDEPSKLPRWRWVVRAGGALASTRTLLHIAGLAATLQRLRRTRERATYKATIDASVREIVGACERLNLVVSPLDQCLPRSIALAHLLARSGHAAQFVIGIRLKPFLAHSWVQQGDVLLNERLDVARTFVPILVI